MTRAAAILSPLLVAAIACVPEEGPLMRPFQDCLGCHGASGDAKAWTVAGTWAKGATVSVTDANGKTVVMTGNDAGNFYTREPLAFPFTVSVDGKVMPDWKNETVPAKLEYGSCNVCHRADQLLFGDFGPEMLPGSDCLTCHAPGRWGATSPSSTFYAAGTFPNHPAGTTVQVGGHSATTNAVGNFYITAPIDFRTPQQAVVAGSSMEGGTLYGGCNRCHVNGQAGDGD